MRVCKIMNKKRNLPQNEFFNWLDEILKKSLPDNIKAISFNLYEDTDDRWSIELVGTSVFDENNSDWACYEIYTTRDNPYVLQQESDWQTIERLFIAYLSEYLQAGKYADVLKKYSAVVIGFADGDLHVLYKNKF